MGDSEIEKLCQRIYFEHRDAIDLILKYRPDTQNDLRTLIEELVNETEQVLQLHPLRPKSGLNYQKYCLFIPVRWEGLVPDTAEDGTNWTKKICHFTIVNTSTEMYVKLELRPGSEADRKRFYRIADSNGLISAGVAMKSYPELLRWDLLTPADYRNTTPIALQEIVRSEWSSFVSEELPRVTEIFERGLSI